MTIPGWYFGRHTDLFNCRTGRLDEDLQGILIISVTANGPADQAGLIAAPRRSNALATGRPPPPFPAGTSSPPSTAIRLPLSKI
jgi:hypothetical protein